MSDQTPGGSFRDILGIAPIAESVKTLTQASVDAAGAVLGRICLPVAEEFGLLLRDRMSLYRTTNIVSLASRAEPRLNELAGAHAAPRMVAAIVEDASWTDDPAVQDLWAGLLVSSCTEDGDDDSNLVFVNLLSQLTKAEARLLKHTCETAVKSVSTNGLVVAQSQIYIEFPVRCEIMETDDVHRIDREIDHLNGLALLNGTFGVGESLNLRTAPTTLALHMYVRCQGSRSSPVEFYRLTIPPPLAAREATLVP